MLQNKHYTRICINGLDGCLVPRVYYNSNIIFDNNKPMNLCSYIIFDSDYVCVCVSCPWQGAYTFLFPRESVVLFNQSDVTSPFQPIITRQERRLNPVYMK